MNGYSDRCYGRAIGAQLDALLEDAPAGALPPWEDEDEEDEGPWDGYDMHVDRLGNDDQKESD